MRTANSLTLAGIALFTLLVPWLHSDSFCIDSFRVGQNDNALALVGGSILALAFCEGRRLIPLLSVERLTVITGWMLVAFCLVPSMGSTRYYFRDYERYGGLLQNPNFYGLFCGAALIFLLQSTRETLEHWGPRSWLAFAIKFFAMLILIALLAKTYSRGAWGATLLASTLWVWHVGKAKLCQSVLRSHPRGALAWLAIGSILVLMIAGDSLLPRLASVINPNDFSWRNRGDAWVGGLRLIADLPLTGAGWRFCSFLYSAEYAPIHLIDTSAFRLNSYILCGAAAGLLLPLLLLSWIGVQLFARQSAILSSAAGPVVRAQLLLLAVGFAFEGGLLRWETSLLFWWLAFLSCELAAAETEQSSLRSLFNFKAIVTPLLMLTAVCLSSVSDPVRRRWRGHSNAGWPAESLTAAEKTAKPGRHALFIIPAKLEISGIMQALADAKAARRAGYAVALSFADFSDARGLAHELQRSIGRDSNLDSAVLVLRAQSIHLGISLAAIKNITGVNCLILSSEQVTPALADALLEWHALRKGRLVCFVPAARPNLATQSKLAISRDSSSAWVQVFSVSGSGTDFGKLRPLLIQATLESWSPHASP